LLVAAIGPARNSGMQYAVTDRKAKRHDTNLWRLASAGDAPVLLEAIVGRLTIRSDHAKWLKAWALDVNGQRIASAPIQAESGRVMLELDRKHATMYYELTAAPSK
jgi:hypothetical protein